MSDEAWIIEALRAAAPGEGLAGRPRIGIGDDGAIPPAGEGDLVITTDTMVEGVHWDDRLSPEDVGWKLVAVNASDLGAMGAVPAWATLNLSLPAPLDRDWVEGFARGLGAACRRWGLALIGGDTTRAPIRVAALTAGGHARATLARSGGRPGDGLWVTGELGRAAEGFLAAAPGEAALSWLRRPCPPVALGARLAAGRSGPGAGSGAGPIASAAMDLSDGLRADLARLCAASGCGAAVEAERLPGDRALAWRTSFGEDYELLLAVPAERETELRWAAEMERVELSRIGVLTEGAGAVLLRGGRSIPWPGSLFDHFPGSV